MKYYKNNKNYIIKLTKKKLKLRFIFIVNLTFNLVNRAVYIHTICINLN